MPPYGRSNRGIEPLPARAAACGAGGDRQPRQVAARRSPSCLNTV